MQLKEFFDQFSKVEFGKGNYRISGMKSYKEGDYSEKTSILIRSNDEYKGVYCEYGIDDEQYDISWSLPGCDIGKHVVNGEDATEWCRITSEDMRDQYIGWMHNMRTEYLDMLRNLMEYITEKYVDKLGAETLYDAFTSTEDTAIFDRYEEITIAYANNALAFVKKHGDSVESASWDIEYLESMPTPPTEIKADDADLRKAACPEEG